MFVRVRSSVFVTSVRRPLPNCKHDILKMNELILLQIGVSGQRARA